MNKYTKIKTIEKVFNWCKKRYGRSKHYKPFPTLVISYSKLDNLTGEFRVEQSVSASREALIVIYIHSVKTVSQIAKTIIHEYQHYLQNPAWLIYYYKNVSYDDNKYEILAETEAKNRCKICLKNLKLYN